MSVNESDLKFVSECVNIADALNLLKNINDMKVTIDGITARLHPLSQNLFGAKNWIRINTFWSRI